MRFKKTKQSKKESQCSFYWASASQPRCLAKEEAKVFYEGLWNFFTVLGSLNVWSEIMLHLRSENLWCSRFCSRGILQAILISFSMAFQFIMWISIYFQCLDWISWSFTELISSFLTKAQNFCSPSWNWENVNLSKALTRLQSPFTPRNAWEMLLALLCGLWGHRQLLLVQSGCTVRITLSNYADPRKLRRCCWWVEKGNNKASKSEFVRTANYAVNWLRDEISFLKAQFSLGWEYKVESKMPVRIHSVLHH